MIAVRRGVGRDNPTMKTRPPAADLAPAAGAARDFAVAQDARRDDSGSLPPGTGGMSVQRHFRELLIEDVGGP
jgi:hypothetical protein